MAELQRKHPLFYKQKTKIEFSGFERNILVDPLKLTEENEIVSLFNKIQEKLNSVLEKSTDKVDSSNNEFYMAKAYLNELDNDDIFNAFSIDLESDGSAIVNVMRYETCLTIERHIGNFSKLRELIKNELKDNKLFDSIETKSSNLLKPLLKSKKTDKSSANDFIRKYLCLMDFCFYALKKTKDFSYYRDNEFFEIIGVYPIRIRFRNSTGIYPIKNILSIYFDMISKSVCMEIYDKVEKLENVIIAFASNYDIMQQMEIKRVIISAGLNVSNIISKHELDSLLFQVQFELDKLKLPESINSNNTETYNDKELKQLDFEKHFIEIDLSEKGYCVVKANPNENDPVAIQNHVGDLENLKSLLNTINNTKYEKLIELIKNYMGLIESAFEYILKNDSETIKSADYGLFETLIVNNNFSIRLKKTSESFTVQDLIVKYFELIVKMAWQVSGFQTDIIYLRTNSNFRIDHQYEIKKYIEKATNNYVKLSGTNKLHDIFFKVQENLERWPQKSEVKSNTMSIQMFKKMLENNQVKSNCLVLTVRENASVMVEKIENKTLNIIRQHIGDFDSLNLNHEPKAHSKGTKSKSKKDENYVQIKLNNDYIDFMRFCFGAFYDKNSTEAKSDIFEIKSLEPLRIRMKNSTEEYKINEIVIRFFQFVLSISKMLIKDFKIDQVLIIAPNFYGMAKQFKIKDILERTKFSVVDIFTENQLHNIFMKLHNRLTHFIKMNKEDNKLKEYAGRIKFENMEKNHTFGIDFCGPGKIHLIVLKDGKSYEVPCHIANINEAYLEEINKLEFDDFSELLEYAISSFGSNNAPLNKFSSNGKFPTKLKLQQSSIEHSSEDILKCFLECLARSVWEATGVVARNVILAVPPSYSIETILMIENCIKRSNLKCRNLICDSELYKIFFQINTLFYDIQDDVPLESLVMPIERNDEDYSVFFTITHNSAVDVKMINNGDKKDIKNHFGDFEAISRELLKNTRSLAKFKLGADKSAVSKVHAEHVDVAESFEKLIEFCVDSLVKTPDLTLLKNFKLFQLSNTSPLKIKIKESPNEYEPVDIVNCYFKSICLSIYRQTGIKPKYVTCSISRHISIDERVKLKNCLEAADIKVMKIISNNELSDLFFNLMCQYEIFLKTPQSTDDNKIAITANNKKNENKSKSKIGTISQLETKIPIISSTPYLNGHDKAPPETVDTETNQNENDPIVHEKHLTLPDIFTKPYDNVENKPHENEDNVIIINEESKLQIEGNKIGMKQNEQLILNTSTDQPKVTTNSKLDAKSKTNPTPRKINIKEAKPKLVNFNTGKIKNDLLSITFLENGDTVITSKKADKVLEDHTANFFALSSLASFKEFDANYHQLDKNTHTKARTDFIKELKTLIKFSLNALKGFSMETLSKDIALFQLSVYDQKVMFKNGHEASISEILITYLKCMMKSIGIFCDVETCKFSFKIDFEYNLYEQFEMKKCIDKSNIKLESLSVPNGLNNLFFHINLKISSLEKGLEYYYIAEKSRFETDLKKRLLDHSKSFGVFLFEDFKVLITHETNLVTIDNHIGNFEKLNLNPEEFDKNIKNIKNFASCFKKLVSTALEALDPDRETNLKVENELFKTTENGNFYLTFDFFKTEHSLTTVFHNYIECVSRTVADYIGESGIKLLLATPFKVNITSEFRLRDMISLTRFYLIDIICENNLINLFRKITSHMQQFSDFENKRGRKTMVPQKLKSSALKKIGLNSSIISSTVDATNSLLLPYSHIDHVNRELLSFNIKSNGEIFANLAIDKTILTITNHIGDFNALVSYASIKEQYIIEKRKNLTFDADKQDTNSESFEKLYSEMRLIKHYRKLIDVCFQHIRGATIEYHIEIDDIFEVIKTKNNISIRFKHSNHEYRVIDVLALYFESISNFVNRKINVDMKKIKCMLSNDFDIYAQFEIRRCVERANLVLMQLSTQDELQNLFLDIEAVFMQSSAKTQENKLEESIDMSIANTSLKYDKKKKSRRRETFCIQLNTDGASMISAVDANSDLCMVDCHVGDFNAIDNYDKEDIKTHDFIENYRNLIKFCINSLGKSPEKCFTQRINLFKVVKSDKIKFISKISLTEYTIEDVIMAYFKYMMTSVWKFTKEKANQIILTIPLDYEEKIALKQCIEKANIQVMKIITKPIAKCFDIYLADSYNQRFGIFIFVDEDAVVLYKVEKDRPMTILSSLMDSKESYKEFIKAFNLHLKRQIPKCVSQLVNSKEFSRDILFKCYDQFNNGKEEAELTFLDETFKIKKTELYEISHKYIEDTCQLINDMLEQYYGSDTHIKSIYYVFANFMAEDLKNSVPNAQILRYVESNSSLMNIAAMSNKLINNDSNIGIVKTLNFNIGFCNHLGIFELLLKQGLALPCETSKIFTTVVNYQTAIELELYRGYRPLERYCEFLGVVSVKDISVSKANKIKIDVKFTINENEELSVEAYERPSNKKLTLETENFKMKSKYENNFHDSVVNKENDERLLEKLQYTSNLINRIRSRFDGHSEYDELVSKKMDEFINRIIETNKIIDISGCEKIVSEIHHWLKGNNLRMSR